MTLLTAWVICTMLGVAAYSAAFVWAVRNRQFSDIDRGRYIALDTEGSPERAESEVPAGRADRYTWLVMVLFALTAFVAAMVLALKGGR